MLQKIRAEKIKKLENFKNAGIDPFPPGPFEKEDLAQVIKKDLGRKVKVAGRIMLLREMGNITFLHLQDESGRMQVVLNKKEFEAAETAPPGENTDYKFWIKNLDLGDFLGVEGERFDTQKGEKSVLAKNLTLLTKSILPLPDKFKGLEDEEEKLRKRYLDILFNPEVKKMIYKKDLFWNSIRNFMKERGFVEVETPTLEVTTGGADANPFATYHRALDMDVYLRISMGELWQKRLMVAGLEKTFEIGRQFRNEGMDAEHLNDYTQMEFYWAYADYEKGMKLIEELYKHVAQETFGKLKFKIGKFEVDLGKKWERYDYSQTVKEKTGIDINNASLEEMEAKLKELGVEYDKNGFNITRAIDNLWKYCRKSIGGPGFLVNEPIVVSPLAKKDLNNPNVTQRFHPIIAGSELGNGYSELNDPIDQHERFEEQQALRDAGDEEAQMADHEFVEALEYGMPPTCGFGMSERVFSFFMNKNMRECQIFPLMKPLLRQGKDPQSSKAKTKEESGKDMDLGIEYEQAQKLLEENLKDEVNILHSKETEFIMRDLAKKFGEDEDKWGIIGLLHDIDWEETKDDTSKHCVRAVDILKKAGGSDFLIEAIQSHAYGQGWSDKFYGAPEFKDKKREGKLQHCLVAAETLTGLIIASALMQPDKKLASVKLKSLKKKFKSKNFAAGCNRELIKECEQAGILTDEFLAIGLTALQNRAEELGF